MTRLLDEIFVRFEFFHKTYEEDFFDVYACYYLKFIFNHARKKIKIEMKNSIVENLKVQICSYIVDNLSINVIKYFSMNCRRISFQSGTDYTVGVRIKSLLIFKALNIIII